MNNKIKYGYFYDKEFEIPSEAVDDCSRPGANDEAVEYWQPKIAMNYWTREQKIKGLLKYGAWDRKELSELSDDEIEQKILWICCHDIKEREFENE